jgi:hypothetical protein
MADNFVHNKDDRHVAFCEHNGSVARIICVAVATLANEKLLERASDNDLLLCKSQLRIKRPRNIPAKFGSNRPCGFREEA